MSPFIWLAVAAVMAVVEVVSFGLITMWFVIGALAAFAANLLGADLLVQIVVFLVVSVVCLVALRPVFVKYRDRGKQEEPTHVGQTAVVKNMAVMALEAIEGTDACIHRGGELARGGAVVAKVAKPQQDDRFDVPTVGLATIQSMVDVGATALAIEADKTLLVEREEMLALAEANNITIAAL